MTGGMRTLLAPLLVVLPVAHAAPASAISASGARYASLFGPTVSDGGLEWWTKGTTAFLSKFTGSDTARTTTLLDNGTTPRL